MNSNNESVVQSGKASLKRWQLRWRGRIRGSWLCRQQREEQRKALREEELQVLQELADRAWGKF